MLHFFPFTLHKLKHSRKPILALVIVEGHKDDVMLLHIHTVDEPQPHLGSEKVYEFKLFICLSLFYRSLVIGKEKTIQYENKISHFHACI